MAKSKNMGKVVKTTKTKQAKVIEQPTVKSRFSMSYILNKGFKVLTFPLYMVYVLLFKIPTDGPARIVGFLRLVFFAYLAVLMTQNHAFKHSIERFLDANSWIPVSSAFVLGILGIVMLIRLFLSLLETFGFSTGAYWYNPFADASANSQTGFDAIEEGLEFRDTLLRASHASGKVEELKKTGFITKERIAHLSSSPEVNEALSLVNVQMRAMHNPDKLDKLQSLFGGK